MKNNESVFVVQYKWQSVCMRVCAVWRFFYAVNKILLLTVGRFLLRMWNAEAGLLNPNLTISTCVWERKSRHLQKRHAHLNNGIWNMPLKFFSQVDFDYNYLKERHHFI